MHNDLVYNEELFNTRQSQKTTDLIEARKRIDYLRSKLELFDEVDIKDLEKLLSTYQQDDEILAEVLSSLNAASKDVSKLIVKLVDIRTKIKRSQFGRPMKDVSLDE